MLAEELDYSQLWDARGWFWRLAGVAERWIREIEEVGSFQRPNAKRPRLAVFFVWLSGVLGGEVAGAWRKAVLFADVLAERPLTGPSAVGGGGGNRTHVRKPSAPRSTCLFRLWSYYRLPDGQGRRATSPVKI